jgi:hypothetical protein
MVGSSQPADRLPQSWWRHAEDRDQPPVMYVMAPCCVLRRRGGVIDFSGDLAGSRQSALA